MVKAGKDANKPKKGLSAYMFFAMEERKNEKYKGKSMGDVSKAIGELWNNMKDSQKESYNTKASDDKKRYEKAMVGYVAPPKVEVNVEAEVVVEKKVKKVKKVKDAGAPKRAKNAFMFFTDEKRNTLTGTIGEKGKQMGELWGKMTDAQKEPFNTKAVNDKKRYEKEMSKYKPKVVEEADDNDGIVED